MYISVEISSRKVKINSDNIDILLPEDNAVIISGKPYSLSKASYNELESALFDEEDLPSQSTARPNALSELLNELHTLMGGRGSAKFTSDRKARLTARLKDFSPDEMKIAAKNLGEDEFMQGGNENGKRYGTIDYFIRSSGNINKWLEEAPEKKKNKLF